MDRVADPGTEPVACTLRASAGSVEGGTHARRTDHIVQTTLTLADPGATTALAEAMAPHLAAGDFLGLHGVLGAGKSAFARAVIAARLAALGRSEDVPSPSYTLVQVYELGAVELWHVDLYRLGSADETSELGLDEAFDRAICLVEWAERLGSAAPARRLDLTLAFVPGGPEEARTATLVACGPRWDWLGPALAEVA